MYSDAALRNMRCIHVQVQGLLMTYWAFTCRQPQLIWLAAVLRESSQLEDLTIDMQDAARWWEPSCLWVCDALVQLRGIKNVHILPKSGFDLPHWFPCALEYYIQGKGGDVAYIEYPTKTVRRKRKYLGTDRRKSLWRTKGGVSCDMIGIVLHT